MKHPAQWTKSDLHHHLQSAIDLEFWTIPLYLTALYSIRDLDKLEKKDYPDAAKLVESVVIQEMLHLEIACNLANALGYTPRFNPPSYDETKGVPFIHPVHHNLPEHLHGYKIELGALNRERLKLFCAIELPEAQREIMWEHEHSCQSIGDLYKALEIGVKQLWDTCYVGDARNTRQKESFKEYHNTNGRHHGFSQCVNSLESALKAIDAIVEQGEGADAKRVAADFRPPQLVEGEKFDPGWFKGHLSHYQKFRILHQHHHKLPEVYTATEQTSTAQDELTNAYQSFLSELQNAFSSEGSEMPHTFWVRMFGLNKAIIEVWKSGVCPRF